MLNELTLDQHIGVQSLGGSQTFSGIYAPSPYMPASSRFGVQSVSALCPHPAKIRLIRQESALRYGLPQLLCRVWVIITIALRRLSANLYREERPVDYLSDSAPSPSVLEAYISETDLARQLKRSVRTLQRLAARQSGPPRIKIGRLIFYRIESVRAWLVQQEKKRAASFRSSSRHLRRAS
jgi:hypothetical protein